MKINAVKSYTTQNNKSQSQKSFKASVKLLQSATDVISGREISLSEPVLNKTLNFLLPKIRGMSDNLHFDISGTGKFPFFGADKYGLKFDMSIIDPKRLKFEILNDCKKLIKLKVETLKDLKNNTQGMSDVLTTPRRFGKIYNPKNETQDQYAYSLYHRILSEVEELPKNQLESTYSQKTPDGYYSVINDCFVEYRPKYKCYAGIEY